MNPLPIKTGFGIDFPQLAAEEELFEGGIKSDHHHRAARHCDVVVLLPASKNKSLTHE